jgi:hypothetical protein
MIAGRFAFDGGSRRMTITDREDEEDNIELHCGDCFEIEVDGTWHSVRIEHSSGVGWYLIGLPNHFQNRAAPYQGNRVNDNSH